MKNKTLFSVVLFAFLFICAANIPLEAKRHCRSRTNINFNVGSLLAPCAPVVYQGYAVETYRPYYSSAVVVPTYPVYSVPVYQVAGAPYYAAPVVAYPRSSVGFGFSWSSRR